MPQTLSAIAQQRLFGLALLGILITNLSWLAFYSHEYPKYHSQKPSYNSSDSVWASLDGTPYSKKEKNKPCRTEDCANEDLGIQARIADSTEKITTYSLIGMVFSVFTGVGAIAVAWWAFVSGSKQWRDSHKATKQELRAYLVIDKTFIEDGYDLDNVLMGGPRGIHVYLAQPRFLPITKYVLEIKNAGQTPAENVIFWSGIGFGPANPKGSMKFPIPTTLKNYARGIVGPGVSVQQIVEFPTPIPEDKVGGITDGNRAVYIFGQVFYKDAFNVGHVTNFSLTHRMQIHQNETRSMGPNISPSKDGNSIGDYDFSELW